MKKLYETRYELTITGKDWLGSDIEMVETLKSLEKKPRFGDFSIITSIILECVSCEYAIFDRSNCIVCTVDVNYYTGSIYDQALEKLNSFNLVAN